MRIIHKSTDTELGKNIIEAVSFWQRLRGYMFYSAPPTNFDGLFFRNCNVVHNSFVRFALDVIFIDKNNSVLKVIRDFRPWQLSSIYFKAAHAIEFPAGTVPQMVVAGDELVFEV